MTCIGLYNKMRLDCSRVKSIEYTVTDFMRGELELDILDYRGRNITRKDPHIYAVSSAWIAHVSGYTTQCKPYVNGDRLVLKSALRSGDLIVLEGVHYYIAPASFRTFNTMIRLE